MGVAAGTIKVTLETLRCEGRIVSRPRSGTYVTENRPPDAARNNGTIAAFALCSNPFFENCVSQLVREASQRGLSVECRYTGGNITLEDALRSEALQPGGFVVIGMGLEWLAAALQGREHRVVLIGDPDVDAAPTVPTVYADAEHAGYLATRRLLNLGHRRVLYLHGSRDVQSLRRRRRWRGHERALRDAEVGEPLPTASRAELEVWLENPEQTRRFFSGPNAPTAVVAWYDALAVQLIAALRQAEVRVPDDVSVMGYDNLPLGAHTWPPLDTVDLHMDEQVRHALDLLSLPAGPRRSAATTLIMPTLVGRASCAPPPLRLSRS